MFRLVMMKLINFMNSIKNRQVFADPNFAQAISSLLNYSIKCANSDFLIQEQSLVLKFLYCYYGIVFL